MRFSSGIHVCLELAEFLIMMLELHTKVVRNLMKDLIHEHVL